jgi:anti-sigma regulatory factor (Ser/Thr protein kinase)
MDMRIALRGGPKAAGAAREYVDALGSHLPLHLLEDVRLLTSEVVTNSVRHGGAGEDVLIGLRIETSYSTVRVEVADHGRGFAVRTPTPGRDQMSGWGLVLVDRIADRWGVVRDGAVLVWFELDLSDEDSAREPSFQASA